MSNLDFGISEIVGLSDKNAEFLTGVKKDFTKGKRKEYIFLIRSFNNEENPIGLAVNSVDAKRDILHFAIGHNPEKIIYPLPNVYIRPSEIGDHPVYLDPSQNLFPISQKHIDTFLN